MDNTLTLALDGEITLTDFAETTKDFKALVTALSQEIGGKTKIDWRIDDLNAGSSMTTVRGASPNRELVEGVVRAYNVVGNALQHRVPIPYSDRVSRPALKLRRRVKGSITSIRLETPLGEAIITQEASQNQEPKITYAYGQMEGIVQTLTSRGGLRFILYDILFDKAISCYLDEGQEHIMRGAWGSQVIVSGLIGREPERYRPVVVRQIQKIDILDHMSEGSYLDARGAIPYAPSMEKPEAIIRRMRDAW